MAEARRRFAELLDEVQAGGRVTITRRGRAVAQVLSAEAYDLLLRGRPDVWVAVDGYRGQAHLEDDGWAEDLRDPDPGRGSPFSG